jgi:membrane fusion protein, heavy metal efflux system
MEEEGKAGSAIALLQKAPTAPGVGRRSRMVRRGLIAACLFLLGCGQHASNDSGQTPASNSRAPSEPGVTLSASQAGSIKIGQAANYQFRVEKELTGSVSFAEDPAVVQAESTLLSATATYTSAEKEFERAKALYATKGVSEREFEQATADQQTAKPALDAARNALVVLGKTDAQISQMTRSGKTGMSTAKQSGEKWILANATESDAASVALGQRVHVTLDAVPGHEFRGNIKEIYAVVDPTLHRVSVRAQVWDPSNLLRSGMLADVMVEVGNPVQSLSIPANGVVREGDGTVTAWVTTDRQRFTQKQIAVGLREDGRAQILRGLRQGQLVVTDGAVFLDNMLQAPSGD